jgi:hypothetical protein
MLCNSGDARVNGATIVLAHEATHRGFRWADIGLIQ